MTFVSIPQHSSTRDCAYLASPSGCYWCCEACNLDRHTCHFCGDSLRHDGRLWSGEPNRCYEDAAP